MRLNGKVALISGAASGIGADAARSMVANGAAVMIADILDEQGAELAKELGESAEYVHLDVTSAAQWSFAVRSTVERYGKLNVLVNNAGIVNGGALGAYTEDDWQKIINVNLTGAFLGMNAAVDELKRAAPSSIINMSSIVGLNGLPGLHGYTASKFGLRGLTKSAALELVRSGVRVNSVHPSGVRTPMTAGLPDEAATAPMGRFARTQEITGTLILLASDESSFTTGAEFPIDGGESAGSIGNLAQHL